jgi:hypothetical protein
VSNYGQFAGGEYLSLKQSGGNIQGFNSAQLEVMKHEQLWHIDPQNQEGICPLALS